jgi:hypothetical protein
MHSHTLQQTYNYTPPNQPRPLRDHQKTLVHDKNVTLLLWHHAIEGNPKYWKTSSPERPRRTHLHELINSDGEQFAVDTAEALETLFQMDTSSPPPLRCTLDNKASQPKNRQGANPHRRWTGRAKASPPRRLIYYQSCSTLPATARPATRRHHQQSGNMPPRPPGGPGRLTTRSATRLQCPRDTAEIQPATARHAGDSATAAPPRLHQAGPAATPRSAAYDRGTPTTRPRTNPPRPTQSRARRRRRRRRHAGGSSRISTTAPPPSTTSRSKD